MAYVRLNMVEFKSTKDMRKDMGEMHKSMKSVYPIYVCLLGWKHLKHRMLELLFMITKRLPIARLRNVTSTWREKVSPTIFPMKDRLLLFTQIMSKLII